LFHPRRHAWEDHFHWQASIWSGRRPLAELLFECWVLTRQIRSCCVPPKETQH
jgi:hypothetical protein